MSKYCGPFYVKTSDGEYEYAYMCKECAFGSEEDNICALNPCTYLYAVAEAEEESNG